MPMPQLRRPHLLPGILRMPGAKLFPRRAHRVRFALPAPPGDNIAVAQERHNCVCARACAYSCRKPAKKGRVKARRQFRKNFCQHDDEDERNNRQETDVPEFRRSRSGSIEERRESSIDTSVAGAEVLRLTPILNQRRHSFSQRNGHVSVKNIANDVVMRSIIGNEGMRRRYEEYVEAEIDREVLQKWVFYTAKCDRIAVGRARRRLSPEMFSVVPFPTLHSLAFLCRESHAFHRALKKMQQKKASIHIGRHWELFTHADYHRSGCKCHNSERICIRSMLIALVSHAFRASLQLATTLPDQDLVDAAVAAVLLRIGASETPTNCRKLSRKDGLFRSLRQKLQF